MLLDQQVRYIRYPKFQDKGCEASPDGKYMAIVENRDGKDYIGIYTASGTTLLKVLYSMQQGRVERAYFYKSILWRIQMIWQIYGGHQTATI